MSDIVSVSFEEIRDVLSSLEPQLIPADPQLGRAAVVLLFRRQLEQTELLFIRRSEHPRDPWSGHMAFPGGRVDADDASPLLAAYRELHEELGLALHDHAQPFGRLSDLRAMARGRFVDLVIEPFVFELQNPVELTPSEDEVAELVWVSLDYLLEPKHRETLTIEVQQTPWVLPCYRIEGRTIWGLTLRMLDELLDALTLRRKRPAPIHD